MKEIKIQTKQPYSVYIGQNIIYSEVLCEQIDQLISQDCCKVVFIIDANLSKYFGSDLLDYISSHKLVNNKSVKLELLNFNISEQLKTRATKEKLEDKLLEINCGRDTALIAIGGGVLLDLVGFVAATYKRGVPVVYIPTSLLAMVDASIGGKTGVNTIHGKNLIGAIKQPYGVIIDINVLNTLPEAEYYSALAEVIKIAIVADKDLFDYIVSNKSKILSKDNEVLQYIITRSVELKKNIVEQDEHEHGLREVLNFGHTIGHAIEKLENYSVSHGYAVAYGILIESRISHSIGVLSNNDLSRIEEMFNYFFANRISFKNNIQYSELKKYLAADKKSKSNKAHYVLIKSIGGVYSDDNKYSFDVEQWLGDETELKLKDILTDIDCWMPRSGRGT